MESIYSCVQSQKQLSHDANRVALSCLVIDKALENGRRWVAGHGRDAIGQFDWKESSLELVT